MNITIKSLACVFSGKENPSNRCLMSKQSAKRQFLGVSLCAICISNIVSQLKGKVCTILVGIFVELIILNRVAPYVHYQSVEENVG